MRPDEFFSVLRPYGREILDPTRLQELVWNSVFLEFVFWGLVVGLACLLLKWRPAVLVRVETLGCRVSRRCGLSVVMVILLALGIRLALLPLIPIPDPIVHDEYSYLLQAKTLALGRITNPTPAMWVHLESFHINMRPTYQSMYPPGQALPMAAAVALHLHPWFGVWLMVGLMCGAVCWMLQGWMPPPWALLGGLFCVIRFSTFSYWVDSYWGGALAAIGGALVFGSLPRMRRTLRVRYALLFALGIAILANTRPYEGLVFSLPVLVSMAVWMIRKPGLGGKRLTRVVVPAAAVLLVAAAGMAYYNWRSTGNPLLMPYKVNQDTYHITRPFLWQARNPVPNYHHQVMRTFYVFHELPDYIDRQYSWGLRGLMFARFQVYYEFFVWPLMTLSVFSIWQMMKSRKMRLLALTILLLLAGLLIEQWPPHAHYPAPALCLVIAMVLFGLRLLRTWRPRGTQLGLMMSRAVVMLVLAWSAFPLGGIILNPYHVGAAIEHNQPTTLERARLLSQLQRVEGLHLVIVHTRRSHNGGYDWVYNEPDLEHAKVIWARDMGEAANQDLLRYYANRHVWYVDQDNGIMRLTAYDRREDGSELAGLRAAAKGFE